MFEPKTLRRCVNVFAIRLPSINIRCATFYFIFLIMKLLGNPKIETFKKKSNLVQMNQIKI